MLLLLALDGILAQKFCQITHILGQTQCHYYYPIHNMIREEPKCSSQQLCKEFGESMNDLKLGYVYSCIKVRHIMFF
jgi:hypothetical protein